MVMRSLVFLNCLLVGHQRLAVLGKRVLGYGNDVSCMYLSAVRTNARFDLVSRLGFKIMRLNLHVCSPI
jgi:hypothetical protein